MLSLSLVSTSRFLKTFSREASTSWRQYSTEFKSTRDRALSLSYQPVPVVRGIEIVIGFAATAVEERSLSFPLSVNACNSPRKRFQKFGKSANFPRRSKCARCVFGGWAKM